MTNIFKRFVKTQNSQAGFTLLELLLYAGILGFISVGLLSFFSETYRYYFNVKNRSNVSQNLRFVSQMIEQSVRQSQRVDGASSTLSLIMNESSKSPTIFGVENGRVYKKEGSGAKNYISASNVEVTSMDFSYLSSLLSKVLSPYQWAWSGGASATSTNEGVGWINFAPSEKELLVPLGQGDFLGMAKILSSDSFISMNCLTTNSCLSSYYRVYSDSSWTLRGWAWSDLYGWISFNSLDTSSTEPYSVSISSSTGDFSGWAWSENIGWLSFNCANPEVSSCGTSDYKVRVNKNQGTPVNTVYVNISMRSRVLIPQFAFSDTYSFSVPIMPVSNVTVVGANPSSATSTVTLTVTGTNFQSGAKAKLSRSGYSDIFPTTDCTYVSSASLQSCAFDVSGKEKGYWNLMVVNPDGQLGIKPQGFQIQ